MVESATTASRGGDTLFNERIAAIEAELSRPRRRLRLEPGLEQAFDARTGGGRVQVVRYWHVGAIAANLACLALDYGAGLLPLGLALRLGLVVPLYVISILFLERGPAWLRGAAVVVPCVAMVAAVGVLGQQAAEPHGDRYLMAAGLQLLFTNIAVPFRFGHAALATGGSLLALVVTAAILSPVNSDSVAILSFIVGIAMISLTVRFRADRAMRNSFLARLRDETKSARLVALADTLARIAETDETTGLFNRRHLAETLKNRWREARDKGDWIGLLMIDIDYFKAFNDTAGHEAGDRCLKSVAATLDRETRSAGQYLARYGGEEFVAILSGLEPAPVLEQAEKLRQSVQELRLRHPGFPDGRPVTVSIGASAAVPAPMSNVEELMIAADKALYVAKAAGRNRVEAAAAISARPRESRNGEHETLAPIGLQRESEGRTGSGRRRS